MVHYTQNKSTKHFIAYTKVVAKNNKNKSSYKEDKNMNKKLIKTQEEPVDLYHNLIKIRIKLLLLFLMLIWVIGWIEFLCLKGMRKGWNKLLSNLR